MDAEYEGNVEGTGEDYSVEPAYTRGQVVRHMFSLRLVIPL